MVCPITYGDHKKEDRRNHNVEINWGVQTTGLISAASGPKFTILWGHLDDILLLNNFFRLSISAFVGKA